MCSVVAAGAVMPFVCAQPPVMSKGLRGNANGLRLVRTLPQALVRFPSAVNYTQVNLSLHGRLFTAL